MNWQGQGGLRRRACVAVFCPDGEIGPERRIRERKAKAICASCPARVQCLDYALGHHVRCSF